MKEAQMLDNGFEIWKLDIIIDNLFVCERPRQVDRIKTMKSE